MKICINPGHGGFDSGAVGTAGLKEKNANLAIALLVGSQLMGMGHEVIFTRRSDEMPQKTVLSDLKNIVSAADNNKCDYLISIHQNAADNIHAGGTETFCNLNNPKGKKLAKAIQDYTVKYAKRADRGVKDGRELYVIKRSKTTTILVEVLFISNQQEEKMLMSNSWLTGYAKGLAGVIASAI